MLLHGLTDSPYSQRHIAEFYRDHGFVAIVIRLPGHGKFRPADRIEWEDWVGGDAARGTGSAPARWPSAPLHLVGFSNGGALAVKYALDAIADPVVGLRQDRIVLISPMIGITRFARFAGLASLPAPVSGSLPRPPSLAWCRSSIHSSTTHYPVNGARSIVSVNASPATGNRTNTADTGQLNKLPPIITFQSVMDFTVSTSRHYYRTLFTLAV